MSYWREDRAYRRSRATHPSPHHEARDPYHRTEWDPNFHLPRRGIYLEQSPPDIDIGSSDDWIRIHYSQLVTEEFPPLFFEAGLSVWTDLTGALRLCDADGIVRAELPTPRSHNGLRTPETILYDVHFRRISTYAATRSELRDLLMESRIRVYENSNGDLHLRERTGRVLGVLRRQ